MATENLSDFKKRLNPEVVARTEKKAFEMLKQMTRKNSVNP